MLEAEILRLQPTKDEVTAATQLAALDIGDRFEERNDRIDYLMSLAIAEPDEEPLRAHVTRM